MSPFAQLELWFVTGSQHLYGPEALEQVDAHAREVAHNLEAATEIPVRVVYHGVLTRPEEVTRLCLQANAHPLCIGLIGWMHTFSPAKMWIAGLQRLQKPLLHLHTQYGRDLPWDEIDMDFMNLHQSAHGGREFGFIGARLGLNRKVVVGYWQESHVRAQIGIWARAAAAWNDQQHLKVARLGDNMREVAVTEGNKVSAQVQLGYSVNGYGLGELEEHLEQVEEQAIQALMEEYEASYHLADSLLPKGAQRASLAEAARIELGLRSFLAEGEFGAFTDTFENLHGLAQLPGIAVQRLMADGFGFGAEGDWKTAALVRAMKVMAHGLPGGSSFMEDYTYHFHPDGMKVLGAHMLEICPSLAAERPRCAIHPLGIGGKADPVRLVFQAPSGPAVNASLIDLGHRFRLLVNSVQAVPPPRDMPKLPVARVLWRPHPRLDVAATAWILAGGAHHTCFSQSLSISYLEDFADMADIELVIIDEETQLRSFKQQLKWNDRFWSDHR